MFSHVLHHMLNHSASIIWTPVHHYLHSCYGSLFPLTCIALLESKHPGNIILWGAARVGMANCWHRCHVWYRHIFRVAPEICMDISLCVAFLVKVVLFNDAVSC